MAAGRRDPQLGRMWGMRTAAGVDLGDADGGRAVERRSRGPRRREGAAAVGEAAPGGPRRRESDGRRWSNTRRPEEVGGSGGRRWSGGRRPEEEGGAGRWLRGAGGGSGAGGAGRWPLGWVGGGGWHWGVGKEREKP